MNDEQYNQLVQEYLEDFRKEITEDILSWGELSEFESDSEPHYSTIWGKNCWPSGVFTGFLADSLQEPEEVQRDQAWFEALEKRCDEMVEQVAKLSYMSFEHGEDPCDLFLTWGMVEDDEPKN